ncbi:hypothetical protein RB620_26085 [Paenibacillus sp. LHD-117]|uniref:hypothetical protein n=1 Tax=Paenibacillus sp. LHD-117 TaxID=3071412 RepID=UPI0027E1D74E|nr:hypothetical protein [Paenibacillus sp. LHD-117]MDQ6422902.1 hypothetical protein [Paenibacillus sp. LHD-117]
MSQIVNPSFETGDFTGWSLTVPSGGSATVVPTFTTPFFPFLSFNPVEGNFFALLKSGDSTLTTTIIQTFTATAGQTISGYAFFQCEFQGPPSDGSARVQLVDEQSATVIATPYLAEVLTTGSTGWVQWAYTFTTSGTFTVRARVNDAGSLSDNFMGLDALQLSCPIANPQTCCQAVVDHLITLITPLALDATPEPVQELTVSANIFGVSPGKVTVQGTITKNLTYQGVIVDPVTGAVTIGTVELEEQIPFRCAIEREDANAGDLFHVVPNGAAVLSSFSGPQNTGVFQGFNVAFQWFEEDNVIVCIRKGPVPV